MHDQIQALLQNEDAVKKMTGVKVPEDSYAIAQSYGVSLSFKEYGEEMKKVLNMVIKQADNTLSEAELQRMAGGVETEDIVSGVLGTVGLTVNTMHIGADVFMAVCIAI